MKVIQLERVFLNAWKILRLFVNTLTADDKYSLLNRGNLRHNIKIHLFQKQKDISQLFCAFFKSTLYFEHFRKKYDAHSLCISEVTDSERRG